MRDVNASVMTVRFARAIAGFRNAVAVLLLLPPLIVC